MRTEREKTPPEVGMYENEYQQHCSLQFQIMQVFSLFCHLCFLFQRYHAVIHFSEIGKGACTVYIHLRQSFDTFTLPENEFGFLFLFSLGVVAIIQVDESNSPFIMVEKV